MAYSSVTQLMKDLVDDCKKFSQTYVEAGTTEACEKIVEFTKKALSVFYGSYSPRVYDRENNIMNNSWEPIMEISGDSGRGGVRLSPSAMHEYWHHGKKVSTEDIYTWVIHGGFHGLEKTSTPPITMIVSNVISPSFNTQIEKYALNAAKKQSYKVLKF